MKIPPSLVADNMGSAPQDDIILPFQLDSHGLRGRLVRLKDVATEITGFHAYPPVIAKFLAEALALTVALGSFLKYDGMFTLQTSGDGALKMLVCDVTSEGGLRGYVHYNTEHLQAVLRKHKDDALTLPLLCGKGYLAFTAHRGKEAVRYQGIVDLTGDTLAACIEQYFSQSEQIKTHVLLAASPYPESETPRGWRSAALILQQMPQIAPASEIQMPHADTAAEGWHRAGLLLHTCEDRELLSHEISAETVLYRLFHEEQVRVYTPTVPFVHCRCSMERIEEVLSGLPADELDTLQDEDGKIIITCEFCNRDYAFDWQTRRHRKN